MNIEVTKLKKNIYIHGLTKKVHEKVQQVRPQTAVETVYAALRQLNKSDLSEFIIQTAQEVWQEHETKRQNQKTA